MQVFIGNLAGEATLAELHAFLGGLRMHADVQVVRGKDAEDQGYHYFVIEADSAQHGEELISRFDGALFHGRLIEAREYVQRHQPGPGWKGPERRINTT